MFRCKVCGWLHAGDVPPDSCPACGSPADRFRPVATGLGTDPGQSTTGTNGSRIRLLALVPATIDSPFARHEGARVDVVTGDSAWFDDNIPCMRACPVNTDVATYIGHVAGGAFDLAAQLNREQNVFAGTLGRTCTRPCEDACRRTVIDGPIQIRALKRVATDYSSDVPVRASAVDLGERTSGRRVAVVGAGVAGLTVARDLWSAGHAVTIFDRDDQPGGPMVTGVPAWRLPRAVVAVDIDAITRLGIPIQTGMALGHDLTVADLSDEYDAVVIATGAQRANQIDGAGSPGAGPDSGLADGLAFLRHVATGGQRPAGAVVVIGGGYSAFDCARTARRLAPGSVTIAMRDLAVESILVDELNDAVAEGVAVECGVSLVGIERRDGAVVAVTLVGPDGSQRTQSCLLVVVALGQRPDWRVIDQPDGERADGSLATAGPAGQVAGWPNVWLAGDVIGGSSSFIHAIASAKQTAAIIAPWLAAQGSERFSVTRTPAPPSSITLEPEVEVSALSPGGDGGIPDWTRDLLHRRVIENDPYREIPPQPARVLDQSERGLASGDVTVELDAGMTAEIGQREAKRCLQCQANIFIDGNRCILCNGCVDVCPYGCIEMLTLDRLATIDGLAPESLEGITGHTVAMLIDEDACIRCGKCVDWCPTSCLTMSAHRPAIGGQASGFDLRSLLTQG